MLFGGSTSGGSHRVNSLMRGLGLVDSEMYGGYIPGTLARRRPIPMRVDERPYYGVGKSTSAFDLAQLFAYIHLAAEGKGRLARRHAGFTASDARYLLYLLAHVSDRGKLDRFLAGRASSLHKAGWITTARHDAGIVYWPGGAFAVAVMTHGAGVGTASDVLAGRVAQRALRQLTLSRRTQMLGQCSPRRSTQRRATCTSRTRWSERGRSISFSARVVQPPRGALGHSGLCALPPAPRGVHAPDLVRQAGHRPLGPGAARPDAADRGVDGRRSAS